MHKCFQRSLVSCLLAAVFPLGAQATDPSVKNSPQSTAQAPCLDAAALEQLLGSGRFIAFAKEVQRSLENGDARIKFLASLSYDLGLGVTLDHSRGLELLEQAVDQGDLQASGYHAWRLSSGYGTDMDGSLDEEEAAKAPALEQLPLCKEQPSASLSSYFTTEGGGFRPRFKRLLMTLNELADAGDLQARANLAELSLSHLWGRDLQVHRYWLKLAADGGHLPSMKLLAACKELGLGMAEDPAGARALRVRTAQSGDAESQFEFARALLGQNSSLDDKQEGLKWLRAASAQGNAPARDYLIQLLRDGLPGVAVDFEEARRVAKAGFDDRQAGPATQYADLLNKGEGGAQDMQAALAAYTFAAELGSSRGATMVAWMHAHGETGKVDHALALEWYLRAAGMGNLRAMRELGAIFENGLGCPTDKAKAFSWYEKAARGGDDYSQRRLAWMLRTGEGVTIDYQEAMVWLREAATDDDLLAHTSIGFHYLKGLGVPKDVRRAYDEFVKVLRRESLSWAEELFPLVFSEENRNTVVEDKLVELVKDPAILSCGTSLPMLCLKVLDSLPDSDFADVRQGLVRAMEESGQAALAEQLAYRAFLGQDRAMDLESALRHAGRIQGDEGRRSVYVLNSFLCCAGRDERARKDAVANLEKLALAGYKPAQEFLASRYSLGLLTPKQTKAYEKWVVEFSPIKFPTKSASGKTKPTAGEFAKAIETAVEESEGGSSQLRPYWMPWMHYPFVMRRAGIEADCIVKIHVDKSGRVAAITIPESVHPLFAEIIRRSSADWFFIPSIVDGEPVNSPNVHMPIKFSLSSANGAED